MELIDLIRRKSKRGTKGKEQRAKSEEQRAGRETILPYTCVIRDAIGDLLMLFMGLEEYKQKTNEEIAIVTAEPYRELCERQWFIDYVFSHHQMEKLRFVKTYDIEGAVDFLPLEKQKSRQELFADLLGVELKITYTSNYIATKMYECLKADEICNSLPRPIIGIMPKSKSFLRDWGRELELIYKSPEWQFIVFHHSELPAYDNIENVLNLSGKTTVMEMCAIALQTDCGGFIDTALMHIYGNLGKPYILIAGGVIPPELRIAYYNSVYPLVSNICGCPVVPCFDGLVYNCRANKDYWKICMSEKIIPLEVVKEQMGRWAGGH